MPDMIEKVREALYLLDSFCNDHDCCDKCPLHHENEYESHCEIDQIGGSDFIGIDHDEGDQTDLH